MRNKSDYYIRKDNFAIKREIYLRSDTNLHLDQSVGAYGHHAILILNRRPVRSGADLINYPRVKYKYNKNIFNDENIFNSCKPGPGH